MHYAERRKELAADAPHNGKFIDFVANCLFASLDDAAHRHKDYPFGDAVERMRNCWHDVKRDLEAAIKEDA